MTQQELKFSIPAVLPSGELDDATTISMGMMYIEAEASVPITEADALGFFDAFSGPLPERGSVTIRWKRGEGEQVNEVLVGAGDVIDLITRAVAAFFIGWLVLLFLSAGVLLTISVVMIFLILIGEVT